MNTRSPAFGGAGRIRASRLRHLISLLRPYRGRVTVMFVSLVIATAAALAPPYLAGRAIDDGISQHDMSALTVIVIAHRLSTISLADEIVVLEGGRVAARGTHAELLESSPLYREIAEKGLPDQVFLTRDPEEREVAGL